MSCKDSTVTRAHKDKRPPSHNNITSLLLKLLKILLCIFHQIIKMTANIFHLPKLSPFVPPSKDLCLSQMRTQHDAEQANSKKLS